MNSSLILSLNAARSSSVRESDLAMTGTTLTTSESFLRTTISMGLSLLRMSDQDINKLKKQKHTRVPKAG